MIYKSPLSSYLSWSFRNARFVKDDNYENFDKEEKDKDDYDDELNDIHESFETFNYVRLHAY